MFNLSIIANTAEELKLQVLDLLRNFNGVNVKTQEATKTLEAPKDAEFPRPVITQEQLEENKAKAPEHKLPDPPAIEEVRAALKELRERKGAGAVREILKAYGADTLSDLKPEDYLGAIARAKTEV